MEEYSLDDPTQLLAAASDFSLYAGVQNDASAKEFLDRFTLPVIISALQTKADFPGLESTLVAFLERIFNIKYGAYLIPQYMVICLLEKLNEEAVSPVQFLVDYDIYPLLLDCLTNGLPLEDKAILGGGSRNRPIPLTLGVSFNCRLNSSKKLSWLFRNTKDA